MFMFKWCHAKLFHRDPSNLHVVLVRCISDAFLIILVFFVAMEKPVAHVVLKIYVCYMDAAY